MRNGSTATEGPVVRDVEVDVGGPGEGGAGDGGGALGVGGAAGADRPADVDGPAGIDIEDVVLFYFDGGGAGLADTIALESGTTISLLDVDGTITSLADLAAHSLINGV